MKRHPEISECEGVYPPREDSYLLLEAAEVREGDRLLDIGTGTGIIAIAAALEGAAVAATDIDDRALKCTEMNLKRNGVEIELVKTDVAEGLKEKFDVITFNPPYLPESGIDYGDISLALESEDRGSALIKRFLSTAPRLLRNGGRAYFVASSHTNPRFLEKMGKTWKMAEKSLFFESLYVFMYRHQKGL